MTEPASIPSRRATVASAPPERAHARPERAPLLGPVVVGSFAAAAYGFATRGERDWVPDEGVGYALGVAGLAMMVLLLLYSLRKHWGVLRRAGRIQRWFHIHMALGILGPTAILFHADFNLGSLNATVAVVCMLTVSLSGVVGRFIYTRIHYEYLGRVATLEELRAEAGQGGLALGAVVRAAPAAGRVLAEFREACLVGRPTWIGRVAATLTLGGRERRARRRALRAWRAAVRTSEGGAELSPGEAKRAVKEQLRAIRRVGEFATYERAFALWHALHLPFCIVLFLAAAVHVVAVHMY